MAEKKKTGVSQSVLAEYFPMIRTRKEVRQSIADRPDLEDVFQQWSGKEQEEFLDFCSGEKGLKVIYDGVFKEIFNPESTPERLEGLLSVILGHDVRTEAVLPNDSVRLGAESSLLYTDIIVQQKDGSLSNVEIQKIGYAFPGERSACYSADHLLRQYKRVRGEKRKRFTYRDIKRVYTIVFFEHSPNVFHEFADRHLHVFRQKSDTGLELELLQEYCFVPLDIFRKSMENKLIEGELEAWLAFLSYDEPERIMELITRYPKFKALYRDIYELCLNMERVMSMYSKELQELDRNTVRYMMDEMQAEIDEMRAEKDKMQEEKDHAREERDRVRAEKDRMQEEKDRMQEERDRVQEERDRMQEEKDRMRIELDEMKKRSAQWREESDEKDRLIKELRARLDHAAEEN